MMLEEGEYYSPSEVFNCISSLPNSKKKKMMMMNKKRFSDEQVRSLESIFENETKLDPKKKVQVARELGLQPRQVAIWFQNKRARYKSKQLERDYAILRTNYNALASQFDNLKKEQHSLITQLQKLKDLAEKGEAEKHPYNEAGATTSTDSRSENDKLESDCIEKRDQSEAKPALSFEGSEYGASMLSDEGSSENTNYFGVEGDTNILTMVGPIGGSLTSQDQAWDDLHPDGLFDQAVDSCQWWDFDLVLNEITA